MTLFLEKDFLSHSGANLKWKVECDALSEDDWAWASARVAEQFSFRGVHGVLKGGILFEKHLRKYVKPDGYCFLIVDDVLTTGSSMEAAREATKYRHSEVPRIGVVLFARREPAHWIAAIWQLGLIMEKSI